VFEACEPAHGGPVENFARYNAQQQNLTHFARFRISEFTPASGVIRHLQGVFTMNRSILSNCKYAPSARTCVLVCAIALGGLLAACSTTEGFGTDVKNLGDNIEDSAARNK